MNYGVLEAAMKAVIKTNGQEEITGQVLQNVLAAYITKLGAGYQFGGQISTSFVPSETDAKLWFYAPSAGTYSGLGVTITFPSFIYGSGSTWVAVSLSDIVSGKQDTISDLATIRSNASAGKTASDNLGGHTVGKDVPSDAVFTDTVYDDTALKARVTTIEGKESGWDAKLDDAPSDNKQYARKNGSWQEVQGGSGGTTDFEQLSNRPKYNGTTMDKNTDIPEVPTKTSDLTNDSGFLTEHNIVIISVAVPAATYTGTLWADSLEVSTLASIKTAVTAGKTVIIKDTTKNLYLPYVGKDTQDGSDSYHFVSLMDFGDDRLNSYSLDFFDGTGAYGKINQVMAEDDLATVATSGSYDDLINKPTIPTVTNDYTNEEKQKVADAYADKHTHANKALLDTYTQTEANLADAVSKKHQHSNMSVLEGITAALVSAWGTASTWITTNGANVLTHLADAVIHITASERTAWNAKADVSDIPSIATGISSSSVNTDTAGAKAVYDAVNPAVVNDTTTAVVSKTGSDAIAPNKLYKFMVSTGVTSLAFGLATPADNTIHNTYHIRFRSGTTATTLTLPSGVLYPHGEDIEVPASAICDIYIDEDMCMDFNYYQDI